MTQKPGSTATSATAAPASPTASSISAAPDKNTATESLLHFSKAFLFLLAGLVALVWNSERLSQGAFMDHRVLGGLHWITLGWLSLSIFGALRVFTGVALGSQGFGIGLIPWIRWIWTLGVILFPLGLILQSSYSIIIGVSAIGIALFLFSLHIVPALYRSKRGGLTRWYLCIALTSLWGAWILGGLAAFVRAGRPLAMLPAGYLAAHVLLAVFGWVGATVVGVGSHLIPMFALSKESNQLAVKSALPIWATVPVFAFLGAFYPEPFLSLGYYAVALGSILWFIQVFIYLRNRIRNERDSGLFLAGGATVLLILSWVILGISKVVEMGSLSQTSISVTFVGLVVIGWLTLFTLGIYHRVIPFLIWFARFARKVGRGGPVPKVKELVNENIGMTTAISALVGAIIWGDGLIFENAHATYCGSSFILFGSLLSLLQLKTLLGEVKVTTKKGGSAPWVSPLTTR